MTDYKYEKIEFNDLIEMLQAIKEGGVYFKGRSGNYALLKYCDKRIESDLYLHGVESVLDDNSFYTRTEVLWWEKHIGGLVMVKGKYQPKWSFDVLKSVNDDAFHPFICELSDWQQMRPLTQAEKDAIITEG